MACFETFAVKVFFSRRLRLVLVEMLFQEVPHRISVEVISAICHQVMNVPPQFRPPLTFN
jgi:hypothetical protein